MKRAFLIAAVFTAANAAPPVVSNISVSQRSGTKLMDIYYDVSDADGDLQQVQMQASGDGGITFTIPCVSLSGDLVNVAPGTHKHIVWNAGVDWNGQYVVNLKVRVTANDGTTPPPPPGMAYIPAGPFQMGDASGEDTAAIPNHNIYLSNFFMDRFEVSKELWQSVAVWSTAHGYGIDAGEYRGSGHPVCDLTWYEAVKWCNARSEKEGLPPCYYTDTVKTTVYRSGMVDINASMVAWDAKGYRLPTEAEWEKAARGGTHGQKYPWGHSISGDQANYFGNGDPFGTTNNPSYNIESTPIGYYNGNQVPAGLDMRNGYGLYDMAGNVREWCWDWSSSTYYAMSDNSQDPRGPDTGVWRILRGGGYDSSGNAVTCYSRINLTANSYGRPYGGRQSNGLRCVRSQ